MRMVRQVGPYGGCSGITDRQRPLLAPSGQMASLLIQIPPFPAGLSREMLIHGMAHFSCCSRNTWQTSPSVHAVHDTLPLLFTQYMAHFPSCSRSTGHTSLAIRKSGIWRTSHVFRAEHSALLLVFIRPVHSTHPQLFISTLQYMAHFPCSAHNMAHFPCSAHNMAHFSSCW
jgi:hypothetical protein